MSQIVQCLNRRGPLDLGEETDIFVDIDCDGYLDEEAETAILNSTHLYTEEEVRLRTFKKEPLPAPPKEKKQLRLSFQSPELRRRFESVISEVPGRREEAEKIFKFMADSQNGASAPLCLHGNTGCGKTSLITKIMDFFQENSRTVRVAYLNCMSMWSTTHVYKGILSKLFQKRQFDRREKRGQHADTLNKLLSEGKGSSQATKIIILDEIDQFINDQNFLYNMLEWLSVGSKLILVFISNIIDLTLKLDSKLQSRFKFQTIIFKPYSYLEVQDIIFIKYPDIRTFVQKDAITFVAKKIANINSDIRLLEKMYARMETEHRQNGGTKLLNLQAVSGLISQQNKLPVMLAPYAIVLKILNKAQKKEEISHEIMHRLFIQGNRMPESKEILLMFSELQDCGLITLTNNRKTCDVTFYDYGIRIHESLHLLYDDEDK